jgi:hypothetical protein
LFTSYPNCNTSNTREFDPFDPPTSVSAMPRSNAGGRCRVIGPVLNVLQTVTCTPADGDGRGAGHTCEGGGAVMEAKGRALLAPVEGGSVDPKLVGERRFSGGVTVLLWQC